MTKKGVTDFITNLILIIILAVILFAYFAIFSAITVRFGGVQQQKIMGVYTNEGGLVFSNYLRTPVIVDGNEMDMYDLICIACNDQNYEDKLMEETIAFLDYSGSRTETGLSYDYKLGFICNGRTIGKGSKYGLGAITVTDIAAATGGSGGMGYTKNISILDYDNQLIKIVKFGKPP